MRILILTTALAMAVLCSCIENSSPTISVNHLNVEYLPNPLGIDEIRPRLAWQLSSSYRNKAQSAYRILVASSLDLLEKEEGDLWDSGKKPSSANKQIGYSGQPLNSKNSYYWKVKVWDENDLPSDWSEVGFWSMGILADKEWQAEWIGYTTKDMNEKDTLWLPPSAQLRKSFTPKAKVKRATVYVSALGIFDMSINGRKVGKDLFAPGWTDYNKRVYYKTYDVTDHLLNGENVIGAVLGDGWYSGYVGPYSLGRPRNRELYGKTPGLLCQLDIEYEDGSRQQVVSDESWKANEGPIVFSDLLMGETYNANLEMEGWNAPGFDASNWQGVSLHQGTKGVVEAYPGNCVQVYDQLPTENITKVQDGVYIFDLGQNFAGHARLKIKGNANDTIVMRFGEMLHPDGRLMTENLRFARATDTYILKGNELETWEPRFTYHGFRYVEVKGLKSEPEKDMVTGVAVSSATPRSSTFHSSDDMLNQLYSNVVWTQRSNFMDVPTDSPQRDERLGWLGDAQIFSKSALYNCKLGPFYKKWIQDVEDAQYDFGAYANFAPQPYPKLVWYSPGWMEAGIMIPYNVFKFYGDTRLIEKHYASMTKFMDYHIKKTEGRYFYPENSWTEINPKGGFGDWLSLTDKNLAHDLMASIYFANAVNLMAEMSSAIGEKDKAQYYQKIFVEATQAIKEHYLSGEGKFGINEEAYGDGKGYFEGEKGFTGHTQSAYASALYFDVLKASEHEGVVNNLANLVEQADGKPTSGILGIRQLLPGLAKAGLSDLAYQILLNKDYPGWGFEIENGATTIWERWNSYTHEKGFNGPMNAKMNSFNHYAFGAVSEFLFSNMAGIQPQTAGFNQILIQPDFGDKSIGELSASYSSINGLISSSWSLNGNKVSLDVQVPVNTRANVVVPADDIDLILEGGKPISNLEGVKVDYTTDDNTIINIGSGHYNFEFTIKE